MRALVASSASFGIGVALSVGDFRVPQSFAVVLLLLGALGYLYMLVTWEPVCRRIIRARKVHPMLSTIVVCIVGAALFGIAFWLLPGPTPDYRLSDGLVGEIERVEVADYSLPNDPDKKIALVFLVVSIRNNGTIPSIVDHYEFAATYTNGVVVKGHSETIPERLTIGLPGERGFEIYGEDALNLKTFRPIPAGHMERGRLLYRFDDTTAALVREQVDTFELSYSDGAERKYVATHSVKSTPILKPDVVTFPGIRTGIPDSLRGTIDSMAIGELVKQDDPAKRLTPFASLVVSIRNTGAPSIIENYEFVAALPNGARLKARGITLPEHFTLVLSNDQKEEIYREDALNRKTVQPIPTGGMVRGRLMYIFENTSLESFRDEAVVFILSYADSWGKRYELLQRANQNQRIGPQALDYPGLKIDPPAPKR